ncbi:hypothetical protein ACJRO7_028287 [Eucalyptus globulus]|uniref:Uncharacterized protein n=1 Tax=Eucalyptus globulus TaxID=34317 RepID=A0ABD3K6Y0_EUCGL
MHVCSLEMSTKRTTLNSTQVLQYANLYLRWTRPNAHKSQNHPEEKLSNPHYFHTKANMTTYSLIVTSSPSVYQVEINGIKIIGSPVFNDGNLVVFGIEEFFNPEFRTLALESKALVGAMRSKGNSVMASWYATMKLKGDNQMLTVVAPLDEAMVNHTGSFSEYPWIFQRHVFNSGTSVHTHLEGFDIEVTRIGDALMLNGLSNTSSDVLTSEWLSVHGVLDVIAREG